MLLEKWLAVFAVSCSEGFLRVVGSPKVIPAFMLVSVSVCSALAVCSRGLSSQLVVRPNDILHLVRSGATGPSMTMGDISSSCAATWGVRAI